MRVRMLTATLTAALALGGCAGDTDVDGTGDTGAPTEQPSPAAVTMASFAFEPAELSVPVGTTVTFTNDDEPPHTATADDGAFDTGQIASGASTDVTLDTAGSFGYHCEIHPSMTATITVEG